MTITHRKRLHVPDEVQVLNEPGLQIQCDSCVRDLTHSVRIKCADEACMNGDGIDICPSCFCAGKEFKTHKRGHAYRVVELHSYPIFVEDWGADEELLLLEALTLQGLGNWQAVAEHIGTRTKEEVEQHYNAVYINSSNWPLPRMDLHLDVDPSEFQERKRRRISSMSNTQTAPKAAPTSAPGVHEIATFLPGRLEFEHELDNEAEDLIKDLEFGICLNYGGESLPVDTNDVDVLARAKMEEEKIKGPDAEPSLKDAEGSPELANGHSLLNGSSNGSTSKKGSQSKGSGNDGANDGDGEEPMVPPPFETSDSIDFKLTLIGMYLQRVDKRAEGKSIMFNRGLLEYKKLQALEKKRPKEERELLTRLRPLAKLQTAQDFEEFVEGILYESTLRKRIQELQHYRRMGLTTVADIERYEQDSVKRSQAKQQLAQGYAADRLQMRVGPVRSSTGPDARRASVSSIAESEIAKEVPHTNGQGSTGSLFRKQPAPLNLANSPSIHLLAPAEQALCQQLRILPKPYLVIKETLVREFVRRNGNLRRREARDLVKIDVNKTSRVWDFLVKAGFLKVPTPGS